MTETIIYLCLQEHGEYDDYEIEPIISFKEKGKAEKYIKGKKQHLTLYEEDWLIQEIPHIE